MTSVPHIRVSLLLALTGIAALLLLGCDRNPFHKERKSRALRNAAPETFLFLAVKPDTLLIPGPHGVDTTIVGLDTTASRQILHWWGEDADGEVVGYYIQWDYQPERQWTTAEYDTFYLPIRARSASFTFRVWAVDDDGAEDPTPATMAFPVYNSPPEIAFRYRSNPPAPPGNPNVTAYTFPTRTFMWDVRDPDGDESVVKILYALDDTTTWQELPGTARSVTLTGLSPGSHRFFVKAEDIAGAQSRVVSFPDPTDPQTPNTWVVKEPCGDVLLVNDFAQDQSTYQVQGYYEQLLRNIVGEGGYSVWEIGTWRTPVINPQNSLPYATADIKANLSYFRAVIWFSHLGRPNLAQAGLSITQYIAAGGKVFITNANEEVPDTAWTFTDLDSVFRLNPGGRLLAGVKVIASFTNSPRDSALTLKVGKLIGNRVSALVPGPQAQVVWRMEPDSTASVAVPYKGSPVVGVRYILGKGRSIYFSLPFTYCDGFGNAEEVLRYILREEFGL
ncbi:MAG: hypothetical protein QHJ34_14685 [bacterium]|nr:hypothetical protein [candidate division KSB1 bacterium]MDH7561447.1 hypothetical protein [bacterium]